MWHIWGTLSRGDLEIIQVIHHCPKLVRIGVQEQPTVAVPRQALVPPPTEQSLCPCPLDMGKVVMDSMTPRDLMSIIFDP